MSSHPREPLLTAPRPFSRREILRIGGTGLLGLSLSRLLAAEAGPARLMPAADACILIMLNGGPSHLDMWDMKPTAPDNIRGEFKPIASSLMGVQVCEHLPKLSQQMHRGTLIRSMHHGVNNSHAAAVYVAMTGHDRGEAGGGARPTDNPYPGAVAALLQPTRDDAVPHAALPYKTKEGAGGPPQPGFYGGYLGRGFDPLWILKDPNVADFSVPELVLEKDISLDRLAARGQLLTQFNSSADSATRLTAYDALGRMQRRALDVLTSSAVRGAFLLDQEPAKTRDDYGRNIYGQSVLLARRLVEAGTRVVTISWAPDANSTWDTHGGNFVTLKNTLLPQFDSACGALLADLAQRGMLERTLVVVTGDFGRTPKINGNNAGRDHWNYCYTIMLAGGGVKAGSVFGASDRIGAFPADRPVTPGDVLATIYQLLGIDHRRELFDAEQRPHRIVPRGDVISDLLA